MLMGTVLHIWANPRPISQSYSQRVAEAFLERYRQISPGDEIIDIDLYQEPIPFIDEDILKCWDQLLGGSKRGDFSREAQAKLSALDQLVAGFMAADKYIFVTPLWNLSVPPMLKAYIDTICIAGKTFKYTAQGPVGLLKNKKAVHIQARGGVYTLEETREFELGDRYIRTILSFMGVQDIDSVIAEGMAQNPELAEQIVQKAIEDAKLAAERFAQPPLTARPQQFQSVHPIH